MKFRTTVGSLLGTLGVVSPTLDSKGPASNLYMQANDTSGFMYMYTTNLISETATKSKVEVEVPGEALVNPGKLAKGLVGIPTETQVSLSLTPTGNALKISAGKTNFSLACSVDVKDLAARMKQLPKETAIIHIPLSLLAAFTKRTIFCIPNDQTGQRQTLSSLKISDSGFGEEALATDGAIVVRVSCVKKQGKGSLGDKGLLIPSQSLQPLHTLAARKKGETVGIVINDQRSRAVFKFPDGTLFSSMTMSTQYPNIRPIACMEPEFSCSLNREELKKALDRASAFIGTNKVIELGINDENMSIYANGDDSLSDQVSLTYTNKKPGAAVRLGISIDYLSNIASSSHNTDLSFGFTSQDKPIMISDHEGEDEERIDIKYVMMGVRLGA